jgi:MerR family transcriptional regulator, light-induced transcriptional regulator
VSTPGLLRIGELSRRSGVSPELLRAWERRYGLLHPTRTPGGLRLYSEADLARVEAMQHNLTQGLAAAEAAALARQSAPIEEPHPAPAATRAALDEALSAFDEAGAERVLDTLFAGASLDHALAEVVIPYLHELGERWERGDVSVAQEHFASNLIRSRLLGLARGWGRGLGPRALLACAPGEQHDLGLIAFGLALRARGWRIAYLGTDTPANTLLEAARAVDPVVVVISAVTGAPLRRHADALGAVAAEYFLAVGGAGASRARLDDGVLVLTGDPVTEADRLTALTSAATV